MTLKYKMDLRLSDLDNKDRGKLILTLGVNIGKLFREEVKIYGNDIPEEIA